MYPAPPAQHTGTQQHPAGLGPLGWARVQVCLVGCYHDGMPGLPAGGGYDYPATPAKHTCTQRRCRGLFPVQTSGSLSVQVCLVGWHAWPALGLTTPDLTILGTIVLRLVSKGLESQ